MIVVISKLFSAHFKGVVPSIFSQRVRTLESLRDTLLFTGTKTVQYFSKNEPFFALCLKIDFPLLSTSLEKPQLTTDVTTTITDAHYLLRRDKTIQQFSHCVLKRRIPIVNNMSSMHSLLTKTPTIIFLIPYYDVSGQMCERHVISAHFGRLTEFRKHRKTA